MCINVLPARRNRHHVCTCWISLEPGRQMVVIHSVSMGNRTQVLCKSNMCSQPVHHLSSPEHLPFQDGLIPLGEWDVVKAHPSYKKNSLPFSLTYLSVCACMCVCVCVYVFRGAGAPQGVSKIPRRSCESPFSPFTM